MRENDEVPPKLDLSQDSDPELEYSSIFLGDGKTKLDEILERIRKRIGESTMPRRGFVTAAAIITLLAFGGGYFLREGEDNAAAAYENNIPEELLVKDGFEKISFSEVTLPGGNKGIEQSILKPTNGESLFKLLKDLADRGLKPSTNSINALPPELIKYIGQVMDYNEAPSTNPIENGLNYIYLETMKNPSFDLLQLGGYNITLPKDFDPKKDNVYGLYINPDDLDTSIVIYQNLDGNYFLTVMPYSVEEDKKFLKNSGLLVIALNRNS